MEVIMVPYFRRFVHFAVVVSLIGSLLAAGCNDATPSSGTPVANAGGSAGYLFCFWNVENLFDDQENDRLQNADREYDQWFARDHAALELKLSRLSEALIGLNGGRGPDIIALAEVESQRAAELLRDALNSRLADPALHYQHVLFKDPAGGRHIATAIITRLPVKGNRTQLHGKRLRILEGHIEVNGHDLVVLAAHWTSRLTDKTGAQRAKYGDQVYGVFNAMYHSNPRVDLLVGGDFNDPPEAPSVTHHLRATGDRDAVARGQQALLLNLFAGKDPNRFGTHFDNHKWYIFDQIAVSPGLLDSKGWSCDPESVQTVNNLVRPRDKNHKPWRFGNPKEREHGYSDHFPVTVRLKVEENQ
jgi:endonuclease/exonuclease/phosphatase family metal-dependent hydrolase